MESLTKDMQRVLNFPDQMEKMLQPPTRRYVKNAKAIFRTPADIFEHPTYYSFVLDMPGLEVNNIKVKVENGILHVAGKKKKKATAAGTEGEEVKPIRIERRRARYLRKFTLPHDAQQEDVKATYRDGVLIVNVAKKPMEETAKPKTVSIPVS
ncbi:17.6 kDa class II heat shock protein-like [Telopea speciosissima]|uniref:17.6 kDa class II heat shock protein-like n=1 Tax=Telopea speciosissima TaxID=54955 RepID=UPI001CC589B7|nr:17.6 kDa class II heat shock protein-like [Telopea speciosissima]XP_043716487.1 17.6 kDa class II heat shock protein-like [Telopea speciosissima]